MKMALMIIDLQKAYYHDNVKASMDSATAYINAVLPWFREKGLPIIWVQHQSKEAGAFPGQEGFEFIDELTPLEGEFRIIKTYGNSFNKTECLDILKEAGIDTVLITGYCAEYCVLSTYRGAADLDLTPVILKGSLASGNPKHLQMVESISTTISYGILKKVLEA